MRDAVRTAAAIALFAAAGCSGSFSDRVRESVRQSVATGAAPQVRVENVAGAVRVTAWSKPMVDVEATKYGYDAQELHRIAIAVNRDGNAVSIVTSYSGDVHSGGVRYRIDVPEGAALTIRNIAGLVDISGVTGNLDVETQAGAITVDAGRVADGRSIDLSATTGAVTLSISPASSARVEAQSTVGDFATEIPGIARVRENIVGARGGGTIGSGSALIRLSTTTGGIALRER